MTTSRRFYIVIAFVFFAFVAWQTQAQELQKEEGPLLLRVLSPPKSGTFYFVQRTNVPPFPFDPFHGTLPVYALDGGLRMFIVDDSKVDYVTLRQEQEMELAGNGGGGIALMSSGAPFPGGGGGTNSGGSGSGGYVGQGYNYSPTNLWLEITRVTNNAAFFIIHPPQTNGVYDLFSTTNLSSYAAGLNLTNWLWLMRTAAGQTNLTLTNIWPSQGWFELGTMFDSDGDGLTDAWERLVSHTDPYSPNDSDGDGIPDGFDPNPTSPAAIPTLVGRSISKCPITY